MDLYAPRQVEKDPDSDSCEAELHCCLLVIKAYSPADMESSKLCHQTTAPLNLQGCRSPSPLK